MSPPNRSRTFEWHDPQVYLEALREMTGLEFLEQFTKGALPRPPIGDLMDFSLVEVGDGRAVFVVDPAEFHYNPIGVVHGGVAATLLDSSMSCAIQTKLPKGTSYTTLEIKVNFVRALTVTTGQVRSEGTVVHVGKRTATAEGRIVDRGGKLYAHATTTCIVMPQ